MKSVLLVIDVQYEYFSGKLKVSYPQNSLDNIIKAINAANSKDIPVILIQHTSSQPEGITFKKGSHEWEIHEEVLKRKRMCIIEKCLPGSFTGTNLDEVLKEEGIETVVICGYMTQMCCDTTSRQAFHLDYAVKFLSDATGTLDISNNAGNITAEELHNAVLITQEMRFSKVLTCNEWINSL